MCRALLGHLWFFAFFAHIHFAGGDHYLCQHRTVMVCLLYLYLNTVHYQSRLRTLNIIYCPETPKVPGSLIMWAYVHWFVSVTESTPSSSQQIFNIKLSNVVLFVWSQPNLNSEHTVTEIGVQASIQKLLNSFPNCCQLYWVPGEIMKIAPSVIFPSIIYIFLNS